MNMWGLPPRFLDMLEDGFAEFLDGLEDCEAMKKEYLLPKIIDKLLAEKKAQVTLLETADKWFGVTYKDDKAVVVEAIKALIEHQQEMVKALSDNLERALGKVKYLIFYLSCGVLANVVSLLFEMPVGDWSVGAGASGAIFGVVGGLIYVVAVNKGRLEDLSTRQLVVMAVFSLYLGFTSTGVDNTAHVAGLVIGMILVAILYRKPKRTCRAYIWEL